jgi:hypothetical protein
MPAMGSFMLPLLAAAVAVTPSKQPAAVSGGVQASAAVSVTLSRAVRIEWSASDRRLEKRTGLHGEERYELEFQ